MIHFANGYFSTGDTETTAACGFQIDTWANPPQGSTLPLNVDCPKCFEIARISAKEAYNTLIESINIYHDKAVEAKELFAKILNNKDFNDQELIDILKKFQFMYGKWVGSKLPYEIG